MPHDDATPLDISNAAIRDALAREDADRISEVLDRSVEVKR